ncbi:hypothetical protein H2200_006462 [Cladophialophora chaetospira]|uniref:Uncharacterized protein n=1 Tax=Cladophialophora chaetospira TaxID=386627 RepID=A0AA38X889_9EURO|nr:hypothetical protein H2200_006462 [Cladophialophora chaetospira]
MSQSILKDPQDITALPQLPDQAIPNRRSSIRRKPVADAADRQKPKKKERPEGLRPAQPTHALLSVRPKPSQIENNNNRADSDSESSSSSGGIQSPTNLLRTPRHQPLAPNDPSPLNPAYHIPTSDFSSAAIMEPTNSNHSNTQRNEHVLLPPGFKPGRTEHTYVEETMMPAVTHEVIKHNKTEIVQEEITREIHVHHYYTYTQPIKTIEILPARHFIVDANTGEKVEIAAPEGWVMPSNMQPYKPDIGLVNVETRHYLVNEEHPSGIIEPPPPENGVPFFRASVGVPLEERESSSVLRQKKSSASAKWSPFPKVR